MHFLLAKLLLVCRTSQWHLEQRDSYTILLIRYCIPSYIFCKTIICYAFQEPEINSQSTEGLKPEKFESDIVFDDIHFSYPARSDVQVSTN